MIHRKTDCEEILLTCPVTIPVLCSLGHSPTAHCFSALILHTRFATKGSGCENTEMKENLLTVCALTLCAVMEAACLHAKEEESALHPNLDTVNRCYFMPDR